MSGATRFHPGPYPVQFIYKWYHLTPGYHLALFADDMCKCAIDSKENYVLEKLQRGLTAMDSWFERWNININENKTQAI